MVRIVWLSVFFVAVSVASLGLYESRREDVMAADGPPSYAKDVQPILENSCYECHNANKKKKGVDLQSGFAGVQKIVTPNKPDDSRLFKCLIGKGAKLMPPKNPLPEEQITIIKKWIAAGAKEK